MQNYLRRTRAAPLVAEYVTARGEGVQKAIEKAHADVANHFGLPQDFPKRIPIDLRKSSPITAELKKQPEFRMALLQEALYRVARKIRLFDINRFVKLLSDDLSDGRFDNRKGFEFISDPEKVYQWSQLLSHPADRERITSALFDFIRDCQEETIPSFQQRECIPSLKLDDISPLFDPLSTQASPLICEHESREYTVIGVPQAQAAIAPLPVSAARVRLLATGKLLYETKTDSNGHFTLKYINRPAPFLNAPSSEEKIRLEIEAPSGLTSVREVVFAEEFCFAGPTSEASAQKEGCVTCDPVIVLDSPTINIGDTPTPSSCVQVDVIRIPYQLRDEQGTPLPNALLSITLAADIDQIFGYQINTDARGEFLLSAFEPPFPLIRANPSDSSKSQQFPYMISLQNSGSEVERFFLSERINILTNCSPTISGCPMQSCQHEIVREPGLDPQVFRAGRLEIID